MALFNRSRSDSNSAIIDCVSKGGSPVFRMGMILQEGVKQCSIGPHRYDETRSILWRIGSNAEL